MELQSNALSWFTEISRTIVLISLCCSIHRGQQAVSFPGRKGIPRTLVVNRDEHPTNGLTRELFFICSAYITQVYQPNSLESNFPFLYKVNQESSSSQGHFFIFDNGKRKLSFISWSELCPGKYCHGVPPWQCNILTNIFPICYDFILFPNTSSQYQPVELITQNVYFHSQ